MPPSTKHLGSSSTPSAGQPGHQATNTATAASSGMQKTAQALNFVAATQKKLILWRAQNYRALVTAPSSSVVVWPHIFRTGENTTAVEALLGVTKSAGAPASTPTITYYVREFSAGTAADALAASDSALFAGDSGSGTMTPDEISHIRLVADGLSPNTLYHAYFTVDQYAAVTYAAVNEIRTVNPDDSVTGVCNPDKYQTEGPIYDEHAADLSDACNKLWRHNGSHLLSWCCDHSTVAAQMPNTSSTSYADLFLNNASLYLQTQYHSTRRRTGASGVPVVAAVCAYRGAGAGTADFRINDGTNSLTVLNAAITSTLTWFTSAGTLSDTPASWEMQAKVSVGTTNVVVAGWAVWEYEA